jgi:hypothetical protein
VSDGATESLDLPPMPLPPQHELHQDNIIDLQQPQFQPQQQEVEESCVAGTFGTKSSDSLQEYTSTDSSNSSISIANLDTSFLPSPSRSETPLTDHSSVHSSKKIEPVITILSAADREYYDDEISSDFDQELGDADSALVKMDMTAAIKKLPIPPTTPLSAKFSPKRILHRAKSSITDDSVKKLGRRTSMFLEKFHYQQQEVPPLPPLPAKLTMPVLPPTSTTPSSLKSLRRQSSKLTNKGKTLSKKLRKVMSFHQTSPHQEVLFHR